MATSIFKVFSSGDAGAPVLNGLTGSLVSVLDACLVNGYGAKTPVGWLKPIPNEADQCLGCWQQPSGSGMVLFVNDNSSTGSISNNGGLGRDALACGWERIVGLTGSVMGVGGGQFPLPAQPYALPLQNTGSMVWRKSATADVTRREWLMYADASTMYLFVQTADNAGIYSLYLFGDCFSLNLRHDPYKCMILGRNFYGHGTTQTTVDFGDLLPNITTLNSQHNFFIARASGGGGGSCPVTKTGDLGKANVATHTVWSSVAVTSATLVSFYGIGLGGKIPAPNPSDNSLYLSPLWVMDADTFALRGRFRGMYHACHTGSSFSDGQSFSGGNEYAGKEFVCVKRGAYQGTWIIETSNTVETNEEP